MVYQWMEPAGVRSDVSPVVVEREGGTSSHIHIRIQIPVPTVHTPIQLE